MNESFFPITLLLYTIDLVLFVQTNSIFLTKLANLIYGTLFVI